MATGLASCFRPRVRTRSHIFQAARGTARGVASYSPKARIGDGIHAVLACQFRSLPQRFRQLRTHTGSLDANPKCSRLVNILEWALTEFLHSSVGTAADQDIAAELPVQTHRFRADSQRCPVTAEASKAESVSWSVQKLLRNCREQVVPSWARLPLHCRRTLDRLIGLPGLEGRMNLRCLLRRTRRSHFAHFFAHTV